MTTDTAAGTTRTKQHTNDERTVKCPVDGCDETPLARGVHLHVMRSAGNGHGPQGDVPDRLNFDDLETVGSREVNMEYPEQRETERVARLCPYCERPYRGKHGVMIHLGQVAGRKDHPDDAAERHEPDDFAIVHVDENENVVNVVEEGTMLPSTSRRQRGDVDSDRVAGYIESLREKGLESEAEQAEKILLAD